MEYFSTMIYLTCNRLDPDTVTAWQSSETMPTYIK